MLNDDKQVGLASVEVRVQYRGDAFQCRLEISDSAPPALLQLLLDEAVARARTGMDEIHATRLREQEDRSAKQQAAAAARVRAIADKLGQAEKAEKPASDLPARGGQCRAIVVEARKSGVPRRRRPCGLQLDANGVCQGADLHAPERLGAEVKPDPDELF
jgi:hypothetical protein